MSVRAAMKLTVLTQLTDGLYRQDKFQCFCLAYKARVGVSALKKWGGGHGPPGPPGSAAYVIIYAPLILNYVCTNLKMDAHTITYFSNANISTICYAYTCIHVTGYTTNDIPLGNHAHQYN